MPQKPTFACDLPTSSPLSEAVAQQEGTTLETVREALAQKRLILAFQPVVQTAHLDQVAFYEGLIRVLDQKGRIIPAREFIKIVTKCEIGRTIDTLVLEKGFEAIASTKTTRVSLNMSARSIGCPNWNAALHEGLRKDPTAGERLIIEISEQCASAVPEMVGKFMDKLHALGVSFALDNFGSGFASYQVVKDHFFDMLKIDESFVKGIHSDPDKRAIVRSMALLAHELDLFTVAKNVETHEDAETLMDIGVDCMQGYYFGAPTIKPYWEKEDPRQRVG